MVNINLRGDIFSQTGYSSHTRQLINALYNINPSIFLECNKPLDWLRWVNTKEMNMINSSYFKEGVNMEINLPPFWKLNYTQSNNPFIGWCIWEGTNIPAYWQEYLDDDRVTNVVCPSNHTLKAIYNTFKPLKTPKFKVIPHGVNTSLFKPLKSLKSKAFTFIANKGWAQGINDRGGVQWLLKAFCEEFNENDNVELVLKINTAYNMQNWNLANELLSLELTPENTKKIKFIVQNVDYNLLPQIYQQGHCFVSPTMGDAFNIPCLEAMACGLPVITTNFGGQTDYVNNENGWLIDTALIDVTWDVNYEGCKWGYPNIGQLKQEMRYAFEHQKETEEKGIKALETSKQYTWENSAKKVLELIDFN